MLSGMLKGAGINSLAAPGTTDPFWVKMAGHRTGDLLGCIDSLEAGLAERESVLF
jgi:hypothetical protein